MNKIVGVYIPDNTIFSMQKPKNDVFFGFYSLGILTFLYNDYTKLW
jgi:hypothetical protein